MSTALITGVIRQNVQHWIFFSTHFASWFHQNLCYAYPFSHSAGKGIYALEFSFIHWLENLINWHDSVENCCFTIVFYCQNNRVQAID